MGSILTNGSGRALYMFTPDKPNYSGCISALCVAIWPPLIARGGGYAGAGVNGSYLGTLVRPDGAVQITYGGHPLYTYSGDSRPGETSGQGINSFGGTWYLMSAVTGEPIT
jgi:predicted lipoprotein with Yx(FWY)xxD motif